VSRFRLFVLSAALATAAAAAERPLNVLSGSSLF